MINANNILVASDSCYSGTLTRGINVNQEDSEIIDNKVIKRLHNKKSRIIISSGGDEPVVDQKSMDDLYSVFAKPLISILKDNNQAIPSAKVFNKVIKYVVSEADQTPIYSNLRELDHQGGDFIFIPVD